MDNESSLKPKMRFNGISKCKMDAQRRLLMPKLWRDQVQEGQKQTFYLMPGTNNDVKISSYDYYVQYCDYIESLDDSDIITLQAKTIFSMLTTPVETDGQGRFQLTPELLEYSHLGRAGDTLVFVGASDYGRIMTEEAYNQLFAHSLDNINKLNQDVQRLKTRAKTE